MKAKKRLNISIPLWWPSGSGWQRLARWLLPSPGNILFTLLVVGGLLWATSAGALPFRAPALTGDSTTTISYQGRLADSSGNPVTTSGVGMQFRLYNTDTGGSPLWEETHAAVPVEDGLFHVLLGSTNPIPVSLLANNSTLWLGITVGSDSEMTPREQIASVPYAMMASTVADGSITTAKIADEAVTQAKLGADVSLEPPDGSITTQKLADDAVTGSKIAHQFGMSNKEMLNFVLNSDPTDWVYSSESAPLGAWTDLDLSSTVSSTTVAVLLATQLWTGTTGETQIRFRQKGETEAFDEVMVAYSSDANEKGAGIAVVECDSSQVIQFYINAGTAHLRIQVLGWWEPAHQ